MIFQIIGWIAVVFALICWLGSALMDDDKGIQLSRNGILYAILAVLCLK